MLYRDAVAADAELPARSPSIVLMALRRGIAVPPLVVLMSCLACHPQAIGDLRGCGPTSRG
jgi:hypothetical protein